jgi:microcystin-dependent protein
MSSVIDGQQVSLLTSAVQLDDAKAGAAFYEMTSELEAVDVNAPGIARYYSKIIELDENEPADDVILFIDGEFPSNGNFKLYAFFKPLGIDYSENLEDASYFQMFIDDRATEDTAPRGRQNLLLRPYRSGAAPPNSNIPSILSDSGELRQFNKYLIKLVLSHDSGGLEAGETIPQISFIGAAPLKSGSGLNIIPTGTISPFAASDTVNAPVGYLFCDGSVYNNTDYPSLARRLGNAYGGDAATNTFAVPDLRGRMPLGVDDDRVLGTTGGVAAHTLTVEELPSHQHTQTAATRGPITRGVGEGVPDPSRTGLNRDDLTGFTGGNQPHENLPPFVVVNYIIKI